MRFSAYVSMLQKNSSICYFQNLYIHQSFHSGSISFSFVLLDYQVQFLAITNCKKDGMKLETSPTNIYEKVLKVLIMSRSRLLPTRNLILSQILGSRLCQWLFSIFLYWDFYLNWVRKILTITDQTLYATL